MLLRCFSDTDARGADECAITFDDDAEAALANDDEELCNDSNELISVLSAGFGGRAGGAQQKALT